MSCRRILLLLPVAIAVLLAAGCGDSEPQGEAPAGEKIFGNGHPDRTAVLVRVGEVEITQRDLDLRYAELPANLKSRFSGEGWQTRFLRYMVDEVLQYQEALSLHLNRDPAVAQALISDRRTILKEALQDRHVFAGIAPREQDVVEYYERNKAHFREEGLLHARAIVCADRKAAFEAYDQIRSGKVQFPQAVALYTTSLENAQQAGDLGWFSRGGHIPSLLHGADLSRAVWDWKEGLHEPIEVAGTWHVVEVLGRNEDHDLPLEAVRAQILEALQPAMEEEALQSHLRQLRRGARIEWLGAYRPGNGLSPDQLLERAWYATEPQQKIEILSLVVEDFPQHELADDALYIMAYVYLELWHDAPFASRALHRLVKEYPHSDLYQQAQYMLENMGNPDFVNPVAPEELQRRAVGRS